MFNALKSKKSVVEPALAFWEKTLRIRRLASGNILLKQQCNSGTYIHVSQNDGTIKGYCTEGCVAQTQCFEVVIPSKYLDACDKMNGSVPISVGSRGNGIPSNGYLIFVDAKASTSCQDSNLLAYATTCQLETGTDRPTSGYINLCPDALDLTPSYIPQIISTVIHELAHGLGFTDTLYAFLRDENGNPRTPRNKQTGLPNLGYDANDIPIASESTVSKVERIWKSAKTTIKRTPYALKLPSLLAAARKHFNCPELDGVDLENDGGSGTSGAHFEKRIVENEIMSGSASLESYVSNLTLSYFKDTGWYDVNFSMAQNWKWGQNLGCNFVMKSCYEFWQGRKSKGLSYAPFCDVMGVQSVDCLNYENAFGYCDLKKLNETLPPEFQYFTYLPGVDNSQINKYGSQSVLNDRCPIMRPFNPVPRKQYSSFCGNSINQEYIDTNNNYALQYFGINSTCIKHSSSPSWQSQRNNRIHDLSFPLGSCHKYKCSPRDGLILLLDGQELKCPKNGGLIKMDTKQTYYELKGSGYCPPCQSICNNCSSSSSAMVPIMFKLFCPSKFRSAICMKGFLLFDKELSNLSYIIPFFISLVFYY